MSAEETTLAATATTAQQQQQQQQHSQQQSDDLPRAHIKRIMKHQLSKFSHVDPKNNQPFEPNIAKDALDGVQQACKIFIHYLTSTANDICTESKRSTLSADDVIRAMREIDFHELEPQLKEHLNQAKTAALQRQALAAASQAEAARKKQKTTNQDDEDEDEEEEEEEEENEGGEGKGKGEEEEEEDGDDE